MITENDRICFLGDSITFGAGTTKRYFEYIAEKTGAEVHGFGIDGASTAHLFTELQPSLYVRVRTETRRLVAL